MDSKLFTESKVYKMIFYKLHSMLNFTIFTVFSFFMLLVIIQLATKILKYLLKIQKNLWDQQIHRFLYQYMTHMMESLLIIHHGFFQLLRVHFLIHLAS